MATTKRTNRGPARSRVPDETQTYYMTIADAVRRKASCDKRHVGAVLVLGNRIVSTGYNGTPEGVANCNQGGCYRCTDPKMSQSGKNYDVCICVHAEQNALLTAARFGIAVEGADVYTTLAPCFGCMKELLQAKVRNIYYLGEFKVAKELEKQLGDLISAFETAGGKVKALVVPGIDPNLGGEATQLTLDTGHTMPAA
jgi:dCMP deaminase